MGTVGVIGSGGSVSSGMAHYAPESSYITSLSSALNSRCRCRSSLRLSSHAAMAVTPLASATANRAAVTVMPAG